MTVGHLKTILANVPDNVMLAAEKQNGGCTLICGGGALATFEGIIPNGLKAQAVAATDNSPRTPGNEVIEPAVLILRPYYETLPGTSSYLIETET